MNANNFLSFEVVLYFSWYLQGEKAPYVEVISLSGPIVCDRISD
jgi:hypothetical protein